MITLSRTLVALSLLGLTLDAPAAMAEPFSPAIAGDASLIAVDYDHSPRICPQYLVRMCVIEHFHEPHLAWTNPCLAREMHLTIVPDHECPRFHNEH